MKDSTKIACEQYEQMLLDATKHTGNQEKEKRIFSASMLGNEPLQNFLKFKYGGKESKEFGANTLGSIYQLGVDVAADRTTSHKLKYSSGLRIKIELSNGWIISGEMDQIDWENKVIFDNKVSTATTIEKVKAEGKDHQYALQIGVYKWLLRENAIQNEEELIDFDAVLPIVDKGYSYFKTNKFDQLTFVPVETYSIENIKLLLLEATNNLDEYINSDMNIEPDKCKNVWPYGKRGAKTKPMRCLHYCDFSKHCKHFNTESPSAISELLNL